MNTKPADSSLLASQPVFDLVLVSESAGAGVPAALRQIVASGGHNVHEISLPPVPTAGALTAANAMPLVDGTPDVIVVLAPDWAGLADATRRVKALLTVPGSAVLALAPGGAVDGEQWSRVHAAGADAFLSASASAVEAAAQIELLARFGRLQRDLAAAREQLGRNLQFDDLTQLLNRRFFFKAAHHEWARARRYNHHLACLMLEVNYLRLYNTTYGFACGDYVLRAVAGIILQWTRESDVVGRFSEEKFAILLPETDVEGAMMLRENLQRVIAKTEFLWQGQKLPLTISIGESERAINASVDEATGDAAMVEDEAESLSVREEVAELLADADAALTVAKKGARYPALCVDATAALPGRDDGAEDPGAPAPELPAPA